MKPDNRTWVFWAICLTLGCVEPLPSPQQTPPTSPRPTTGSPTDARTTGTADPGSSGVADASSSSTTSGPGSDASTDGDPDGPTGLCEDPGPWPLDEWALGDPVAHGFDLAALEEAADYADSVESDCLLVVHDGELIFERYFGETGSTTPLQTWSMAKSYTSALVGIALGRGELGSVDDPVKAYLPELAGQPSGDVTLAQLLSMTAGMYVDVMDDMVEMFTAPDMTQKALSVGVQTEPGTAWQYSNVATQMFEPILRAATGRPADEYAQEHLWGPLGMNASWAKDEVGNPAMYMNVLASCRDHARFGYLYLHRGCWNGEQLVPAAWVEASTSPSTDFNPGYGWFWWLSGGHPTLDLVDSSELERGTLHPSGPDDSFCAVGLGGQIIEVVPSHDMVIVRIGRAAVDEIEGNPFPLFEILELLDEGKQEIHDEIVTRVLTAL